MLTVNPAPAFSFELLAVAVSAEVIRIVSRVRRSTAGYVVANHPYGVRLSTRRHSRTVVCRSFRRLAAWLYHEGKASRTDLALDKTSTACDGQFPAPDRGTAGDEHDPDLEHTLDAPDDSGIAEAAVH
ncbi:hypothetical protein [Amycolatopsis nivea]|uniref:hypothetical protein n=1 Tax=Amycolatopsis nivea TaxID=1644109 RepID=UPI00106F3359|nr:hypothetical protein [Amycolatopsis nivea]